MLKTCEDEGFLSTRSIFCYEQNAWNPSSSLQKLEKMPDGMDESVAPRKVESTELRRTRHAGTWESSKRRKSKSLFSGHAVRLENNLSLFTWRMFFVLYPVESLLSASLNEHMNPFLHFYPYTSLMVARSPSVDLIT